MSRKIVLLPILPLVVLAAHTITAAELSIFDWVEIAPTVVSGVAKERDGKYTRFLVERVLRGEAIAGEPLLVDLKHANRYRDYNVDPSPLKLAAGTRYVILLQKAPLAERSGLPVYRVVRGPRGARELPAEGSRALLDAMGRFIEIQDIGDDRATWRLLGAMLEETDPVVLQTALGQFLKFRRGGTELLPDVRPLLDHPTAEIRTRACRLIGQIVLRYGAADIEAEKELRSDVAARARRDEVVAVRVAATEALGSFVGNESREILEEIAAEDADQAVRYAAERILLDRRSSIDFQKDAAYDRDAEPQ